MSRLVFGQKPSEEYLREHNFQLIDPASIATKPVGNPCVKMFGPGPENTSCRTCLHLYRKRYGKTYIKCDLRPNTNGAGTDHRVGWPACGKYEEKQ